LINSKTKFSFSFFIHIIYSYSACSLKLIQRKARLGL
jgi:hypothetical protein